MLLFYNCTFITLIFIRQVLEKYSRVLYFNTLLNTSENIVTLLYLSTDFHLNTLLYSSSEISVLYPTLPRVISMGVFPVSATLFGICAMFIHYFWAMFNY